MDTEPGLRLNYGADVNAQDASGRTTLHWSSNAPVTRLLLRRGADTDMGTRKVHTMTWDDWQKPQESRRVLEEQKSLGRAEKQHATLFRRGND